MVWRNLMISPVCLCTIRAGWSRCQLTNIPHCPISAGSAPTLLRALPLCTAPVLCRSRSGWFPESWDSVPVPSPWKLGGLASVRVPVLNLCQILWIKGIKIWTVPCISNHCSSWFISTWLHYITLQPCVPALNLAVMLSTDIALVLHWTVPPIHMTWPCLHALDRYMV